MQITITPETPAEAITIRAVEAWAMAQGKTLAEAFAPWITDLSSAAVNRGRLTEEAVQEAEQRGRTARSLREAQAALVAQRTEAPAEEIPEA